MEEIETREDQEITWSPIRNMDQGKYKKQAITLKRTDYRPGKAESGKKIRIRAAPEELAKAVMLDAGIKCSI